MQLLHKLYGTHDGAGYQLREKRKVEAKVQEIANGLYLAPLHVHNIAHRLEREKGDAHRQNDGVYPENGSPDAHVQEFAQNIVHLNLQPEEVVDEVRNEVGILEIRQDAQIHHHAEGGERRAPLLPFNPM